MKFQTILGPGETSACAVVAVVLDPRPKEGAPTFLKVGSPTPSVPIRLDLLERGSVSASRPPWARFLVFQDRSVTTDGTEILSEEEQWTRRMDVFVVVPTLHRGGERAVGTCEAGAEMW